MAGIALPNGRNQFFSSAGTLLAGGKVYTYEPGTSTPRATYTTAAASVANTNPIILDARGEAAIYWVGDYDVVLKTAADATIWGPERLNASLQSNLANSSTTGMGAEMIGLRLTGTNEVSTTVGPFLNLMVKGLKRNFGAAGDGVTADATAYANAVATAGKYIEIEPGTYLIGTPPAASAVNCAGIIGHGELAVTLKPGAAATKGIAVGGSAYLREMRGFLLDGSLTTNCTGMLLGDPLSGSIACTVDHVQIKGFTGASAVGLKADQVLKSTIKDVTLFGNQTNLLVQGSSGGFPTTLTVLNMSNANAVGIGTKIVSVGGQIRFIGGSTDSAGAEGLNIIPGASQTVAGVICDGMWFEECNSAGAYMIVVDGSAASSTAAGILRDIYFNNTVGARKAIDWTGSGVRFRYSGLSFALPQSGNLRIGSTCVVRPDGWDMAYSYPGNVTDNSGFGLGTDGGEATWSPTYAVAGGGSFSSVSTNLARFRRIGSNLLKIDFNFSGTVAGTVNSISMALYSGGMLGIGANWATPCKLLVAGVATTGMVSSDGAQNLVFTKMDGSAFAAGTGGAVGSVLLEITN